MGRRGTEWYAIRTNIKCERRASRSLTNAGYEVYMPMKRWEDLHHRTKKVILHEIPLFMRYLFVAQPEQGADWYTLRRCDGVECVLGIDGPAPIPEKDITGLMHLEYQKLAFDSTREAKIRKGEIARTKRDTVRMHYPEGTRIRTVVGDIPLVATVTSVNAHGTIEAVVEAMGRLVPIAVESEQVQRVDRRSEAA